MCRNNWARDDEGLRGCGLCLISTCLASLALAAGCTDDMADQPKYQPFEQSDFFANGMASRPLVPGTIARGQLRTDSALYLGKIDGHEVETFPITITRQLIDRGQARFNIFCSPCHGRLGTGEGMVVQRGFPAPPSYHIPRLRSAPVGHFYDVISSGFGRMIDYASEIPPEDRWAIVAYIRVLQLSQDVPRERLSAQDLEKLEGVEQSRDEAIHLEGRYSPPSEVRSDQPSASSGAPPAGDAP